VGVLECQEWGFRPSLRDLITLLKSPNVETLGYSRMSLRDKREKVKDEVDDKILGKMHG
jgi:hypothetical protein